MTRPVVTVEPGVGFGRPTVRGISVEVLAGMVWAGDSVDELAEQYEITRYEVLVACWFQARHGHFGRGRDDVAWKAAWRPWLEAVEEPLWRGQYDQVPDPPHKEETR